MELDYRVLPQSTPQVKSMQLQDKLALITGASSGIGRASALLFARQGCKLVLTARREEQLQSLVDEISYNGGSAVALAGDVQLEGHAKAVVKMAIERYGKLDIAVNNAGTLGESHATTEQSLESWQVTLNTNLTSAFLGAKHQLPELQNSSGGSLIFYSVVCRLLGRYAANSSLCCEQGRLGGLNTITRSRIRSSRCASECASPWWHRYTDGG